MTKHCISIFLLCAAILPLRSPVSEARNQSADTIAIVGATVVDGLGNEPVTATVLIQGESITAVDRDIAIPPGARVINAAGHTLLPGLFDLHTHLPYAAVTGVAADWPKNLKAYLYCGVTTVVDFGTYPETFEPMRRLISSGVVEAPRISFAARMTTPGGHGAEGGRGDFFSLEVLTPREARVAVQKVMPYRPDVIKVFTDGWRYGSAPDMTSMREDTLTTIVEEAHKNGIEVLTHTVTLDKAKVAARAGVDVIAHGIGDAEADEELIRLMKSKGTTYAPTLAVYEPRGNDLLSPLLTATLEPIMLASIRPPLTASHSPHLIARQIAELSGGQHPVEPPPRLWRWQHLMKNTATLRGGGVRFGAGTDAGVTGTYHGWATLRELQLLVAGGLTPLEAITAATGNSARALKVDDQRGTIAVGKLADLVLVEGQPHLRISEIERVRRVFIGGREVDRERLAREIAADAQTIIPAVKASAEIDDFENRNGRSRLDTLWVNATDSGHDNTRMVFGRTLRGNGNYALSIMARMAEKDKPLARVSVPLSRGAVEPVDARRFKGIRFDARGDGEYLLIAPTYGVRDSAYFQTPFKADGKWRTIKVEFSQLKQVNAKKAVAWTGADLLMLTFEMTRAPGEVGWLELDNIRFY